MPTINSGILRGRQAILPSHLLPAQFIAEPSPFLSLQITQFTHYPVHIRPSLNNRLSIFSEEEIRKLQRIFDESNFSIDFLNRGR